MFNKKGKINKKIYELTSMNKGRRVIYPTYHELKEIIQEVILINETTKNISIIPFYFNPKIYGSPFEYDEFMFFIECRKKVTEEERKANQQEAILEEWENLKEWKELSQEKRERRIEILHPIHENIDIQGFHSSLIAYNEYIDELMEIMLNDLMKNYGLTLSNIAYGYFCFEISSE